MSTPEKRLRVSVACTPCRKKKRRCDGLKPVCTLCDKAGRHCEYPHHLEKRKPPTKCYIHALHSRIALLEHQLAQSQKLSVRPFSTLDMATSVEGSAKFDQEMIRSPLNPSSEEFKGLAPNPRLSDAYGHPRFLGKRGDLQTDNATSTQKAHLQGSPPLHFQSDIRDQLLEDFFVWQNTWPPLVHEPFLRKDFSEDGANGYCTPSVLSAILSLSSQYIDEHQLQSWDLQMHTLVRHAKDSVFDQLEQPSLSLVLTVGLLSMRELVIDNLPLASQYISIALRHALFLELHLQGLSGHDVPNEKDLGEAKALAWRGIWMLEKHIAEILGQPSAIRECDIQPTPVPTVPAVEYNPWPTPNDPLKLTSHSMSNFQYACDLLHLVSPVLDEIYALSSHLSLEDKEYRATQTHVAMSEFYNNLPSALRLPSTTTVPLPPHIYQFNLQYHTLKIMLHRSFIQGTPSTNTLNGPKNPHTVHLQSATYFAIRITYIINSYKKFFPLNRLSPFTVQSLTISSLIHILNINSNDTGLAQRSEKLHRLNVHVLSNMAFTTKCSARAIRFLKSARGDSINSILQPDACGVLGISYEEEPERLLSTQETQIQGTPQMSISMPSNDVFLDEFFDWYQLPLNDELLFDGMFPESMWNEMGKQNEGQS